MLRREGSWHPRLELRAIIAPCPYTNTVQYIITEITAMRAERYWVSSEFHPDQWLQLTFTFYSTSFSLFPVKLNFRCAGNKLTFISFVWILGNYWLSSVTYYIIRVYLDLLYRRCFSSLLPHPRHNFCTTLQLFNFSHHDSKHTLVLCIFYKLFLLLKHFYFSIFKVLF